MNTYNYLEDHEEMARLVGVLTDPSGLNIQSRTQFERIFDAGTGGENIDGIGPVRAPLLKALFGMDWITWETTTGLEWDKPKFEDGV